MDHQIEDLVADEVLGLERRRVRMTTLLTCMHWTLTVHLICMQLLSPLAPVHTVEKGRGEFEAEEITP
jgi:hypothetical protein